MLTAAADIDLRDPDEHAAKRRCGGLSTVPDGARVIVRVGTMMPPDEATNLLAAHIDRLRVEIRAEAWNVKRWLDALRGDWPWDVSA